MRKIVILLGIILFMIACEKGNEEVREAKVVVVVYDENGKIATGIPVKMYNEKDYKVFEKDNLIQSPNQKIPDRKTKCVIKTHINIKQNVIFGAKLKPV